MLTSSSDQGWSELWLHGAGRLLWLDVLTFDLYALENVGRLVTPAKKLEDNIRLAELVIEVLQQNEEHHAEVSARVPNSRLAGRVRVRLSYWAAQSLVAVKRAKSEKWHDGNAGASAVFGHLAGSSQVCVDATASSFFPEGQRGEKSVPC